MSGLLVAWYAAGWVSVAWVARHFGFLRTCDVVLFLAGGFIGMALLLIVNFAVALERHWVKTIWRKEP